MSLKKTYRHGGGDMEALDINNLSVYRNVSMLDRLLSKRLA